MCYILFLEQEQKLLNKHFHRRLANKIIKRVNNHQTLTGWIQKLTLYRKQLIKLFELIQLPKHSNSQYYYNILADTSMQTRSCKNEEKCSICLGAVKSRGTIDTCSHKFCFECIKQWAERENTCPVCKRRFTKIESSDAKSHMRSKTKPIKKESYKVSRKDQQDQEERQIVETFDAFLIGQPSHQAASRLFDILREIEEMIAQ